MASKDIEQSQAQSEGKAIGQSNEDITIPVGVKGSHQPKHHPVDLHIPNQENSSATNQQKAAGNKPESE